MSIQLTADQNTIDHYHDAMTEREITLCDDHAVNWGEDAQFLGTGTPDTPCHECENEKRDHIGKTLSADLQTTIYELRLFNNGFTFTVKSELDAYKAAYKYRFTNKTRVKQNGLEWSVGIFENS